MEAIYTKGPMTVSVNAEAEDWRFYKSGIYHNTQCSPKLKRLDHAVVVSGCAHLHLSLLRTHFTSCRAVASAGHATQARGSVNVGSL